jgi:hypothetical protein
MILLQNKPCYKFTSACKVTEDVFLQVKTVNANRLIRTGLSGPIAVRQSVADAGERTLGHEQ